MIEFMVIAAPRSGTTWAANWLCTDTTHCLHDPLFNYHYDELDGINSKKILGVACTGLYKFPDWLNQHPARKVILHRDRNEINESLDKLGLPQVESDIDARLNVIKGLHCQWTDLFNHPRLIYEYLLNKEFDKERYEELRQMAIQPKFSELPINRNAVMRLIKELQGN